ncbi:MULTISPECIES: hypothetical protein [Streptomyces]|uniref:Uncharacterized protein n=2 Tax=Streptomyces TaxID=1883 RepID=A0ABV9IZP8_9ACTN
MSDTGEHLLGVEYIQGNQGYGYTCKTNYGWAALPHWEERDEASVFLGFRTQIDAQYASTKILTRERHLKDRLVSAAYDDRAMYPDVDIEQGERRDFTVTIAGPERHDGEAPYTYVVRAKSQSDAWATALSTHIRREETIDCFVVERLSFEGAPAEDCGYGWNDLRVQHEFWAKIQELVKLIKGFDEADAPHRDEDGWILDDKQSDHDHLIGDYEMDAFPMVQDLAAYAEHV